MAIARDFLTEAVQLFAVTTSEVRLRTVIGRSYYAAYHHAAGLARRAAVLPGGGASDHGLIARFLQNSPDDRLSHAGFLLERLRVARNRADYDLEHRMFADDADEAITIATEILALDMQ